MKPSLGLRFLGGNKHFLIAVETVEDDPVLDAILDENVSKVRDLIKSNCRLTVKTVGYKLNLNDILTQDLNMCQNFPKQKRDFSFLDVSSHNTLCHIADSVNEYLSKKDIRKEHQSLTDLIMVRVIIYCFQKSKASAGSAILEKCALR